MARSSPGHDPDRRFGRFAVVCAIAVVALFTIEAVSAPQAQRNGLLVMTGVGGTIVVVAVLMVNRALSVQLLTIAGLVLMAAGVVAGAMLPDGLDAVAVMPLAGAVMALPAHRGRSLLAVFAVAYAASMAGEFLTYAVGGMTRLQGIVEAPASVAESAVMLAFTYGLVWWVGARWWQAHEQANLALGSQRRLLEVNERLLSTLEPEGVLGLVADSLKSVVAYDSLSIYRLDREAGLMRPVVARDRFAEYILGTAFPLDQGITGWVIRHGTAQCVNDSHLDPRSSIIPGTPSEPESLIVVPLRVRGEVAGTLNVGRMGSTEAHFRPDEFDLVQLFAGQASIALQNAEAHSAVKTRAETDALTGLFNRGAFDARRAELEADPRAHPLALVMLDLDGFKDYNDCRGHPSGDALLAASARAISRAVRDGDLCFRYGGDEFAVLLPRTDEVDAGFVAERIRSAIEETAGAAGSVTASVGVAVAVADGFPPEALVALADVALYRAKQTGGNRVASAA